MSSLSRADILKLARLARLRLSDDEIDRFQTELSAILAYVEQLQAVDTAGLDPTYQVTGLQNITRPDAIADYGYEPAALLDNLPERQDSYIKVKRMLA